ncbi:hypothetical protein CEXT_584691 [Caerostris extrusa]|uniref:Uncharacterized protein n=1 Tax=Caerostris extrusa TaxID=172846 RepID=A0AAV4P2G2_CAEEX|nr:hypothetical protein CEXT_584691 [Caerostris extrusa]
MSAPKIWHSTFINTNHRSFKARFGNKSKTTIRTAKGRETADDDTVATPPLPAKSGENRKIRSSFFPRDHSGKEVISKNRSIDCDVTLHRVAERDRAIFIHCRLFVLNRERFATYILHFCCNCFMN